MKFFSHNIIALLVALTSIAVSTACTLVFDAFRHIGTVLLINGLTGAALYFVVRILLKDYITKKIVPIYKTIYNMSAVRKKLQVNLRAGDIVERVNKEVAHWAEEKTKEISRLSAMEQFRKEFLGNVSHELKTPIFAIQGQILTLLDGGLEDPSINRKYLESCERNIERLINLIDELETINKLETGDIILHKTSFNLLLLVEEIFEAHELNAGKKRITLRMQRPAGGRVMVYADRKRLSQILMNLVGNSINYGREGGETVVQFSNMPDRILVEVADNGIGISEENLPRIFERFYRVDKHRSREHGGSGLGLAIVKHIIDAHGETINVKSELNVGTTFAFTLEKHK
ncbi:MAG: sensor histidine kinase [Prevotellaceae bacterium]|jgi:two-component system phosphate regulon sensor histidine kinase PhoR|nr:sensor histidine kinase [Prevotellaceae bacterium]